MKSIQILFLFYVYLTSCSLKKQNIPVEQNTEKQEIVKNFGIVTYKNNNCGSLIIVKDKDNKEYFLSPFPSLDMKNYPEGTKIKFLFKTSKRAQSQECAKGIPAILSDIEIVK